MGAREYDPSLGRWLSADTIVPEPGNPQSLNRYMYVLGNPLRYADPTGHDVGDYGPFELKNEDDWTEEELRLLEEALASHPFRQGWSSARRIVLRRSSVFYEDGRPWYQVTGLTERIIDDGGEYYQVTIYDSAWQVFPTGNAPYSRDAPREARRFQGTIAHELTHVAVHEHREMLGSYRDRALSSIGEPDTELGKAQNFEAVYERPRWWAIECNWIACFDLEVLMTNLEIYHHEMIALSAGTYMYQPEAFRVYSLSSMLRGLISGEPAYDMAWQYDWVEAASARLSAP